LPESGRYNLSVAVDSAHYNLSAQSFTVVCAVLDFLQRFMVDPILANDPQHQENLTLSLSGNGAMRA